MSKNIALFKTTKKDVLKIAERVNETSISELSVKYHEKYGAGWQLKLSGDIIATAVEWCYRDFLNTFGKKPTMDTFERAFDEFDYWELFKLVGLAEIRPRDGLARPIMRTYAMAIMEGE
jgi:hypothetical protein